MCGTYFNNSNINWFLPDEHPVLNMVHNFMDINHMLETPTYCIPETLVSKKDMRCKSW